MHELETDYLVVGAGASGMGFVDSLLSHSDAEVVLVDRRHRPGGHWLDAYPFVRLHQPSAYYGVNSRVLGANHIDETGPNAGFYERATASEICDYYNRVLEEQFLASGRVRFVPMSEYHGEDGDGHQVVSMLNGNRTTVKVRRKFVDATYVESEIPSRHTPSFEIDEGVRFMAPNGLVHLGDPPADSRSSAPARRRWTPAAGSWTPASHPTDPVDQARDWVGFNRALTQPLELLGSGYMRLQAEWVSAAAQAEDATDFATASRRAACSCGSTSAGADHVPGLDHEQAGARPGSPGRERGAPRARPANQRDGGHARRGLAPDGSGAGVRRLHRVRGTSEVPRPLFEDARINLEYVTIGVIPWSASVVGYIEATRDDTTEKNRLCPPVVFSGWSADLLELARAGMTGMLARERNRISRDGVTVHASIRQGVQRAGARILRWRRPLRCCRPASAQRSKTSNGRSDRPRRADDRASARGTT